MYPTYNWTIPTFQRSLMLILRLLLKSRKELLDMVSTDKLLCTSGHMINPKFGYIEKSAYELRHGQISL